MTTELPTTQNDTETQISYTRCYREKVGQKLFPSRTNFPLTLTIHQFSVQLAVTHASSYASWQYGSWRYL